MSDIRQALDSRIIMPSLKNRKAYNSYGIVTRTNEKENVCDIIYIDSDNTLSNKTNIEIVAKNAADDYFPKIFEFVEVRNYGGDNSLKIIGSINDILEELRNNRKDKDEYPSMKSVIRSKIS